MTDNCINELQELRKQELFVDLTLEQLLYECLIANDWDRNELIVIIDDLILEKSRLPNNCYYEV